MDKPVPIQRGRAIAEGLTDRELHGINWQRVRRGAYMDAGRVAELSVEERHLVLARAVCQASSPHAVVSHISAAFAHGLSHWGVPTNRVHLTRDRAAGARTARQVVLHAARIESDDVVRCGDLTVTSPARTVVDLARTIPFEKAVVIGDSALRLGAVTPDQLLEQLDRSKCRPGNSAARRVIASLDGRSESVGESRSRVAIQAAGLPTPELQARIITPDGMVIARVDFLFPELGVIGEFDGLMKYRAAHRGPHTADDVVVAEKVREDALRARGWLVIRWTWAELDASDTPWLTRLARAAGLARPARRIGSWYPADLPHASQAQQPLRSV
ncbi:hypothetical protein [Nocardia lijiangensis]|uniref:hypothetical protein n=1 Tax=Nocardia lijiangensis TaxID=299618 RepID=UPI0008306540|nr:hypothetical protein [Nocardia lijiangensis]